MGRSLEELSKEKQYQNILYEFFSIKKVRKKKEKSTLSLLCIVKLSWKKTFDAIAAWMDNSNAHF